MNKLNILSIIALGTSVVSTTIGGVALGKAYTVKTYYTQDWLTDDFTEYCKSRLNSAINNKFYSCANLSWEIKISEDK